jgi:hypothetical protein
MGQAWREAVKMLIGLVAGAICAIPQPTMSGRPALVSYIEGHAFIDGREYSASELRKVVLFDNQTLSTGIGKSGDSSPSHSGRFSAYRRQHRDSPDRSFANQDPI